MSCQMRMPAVSRLQKIHNTDVALKAFTRAHDTDFKSKYPTKDLVEGHQEKTLNLIWDLITDFQVIKFFLGQ